MAEQRDPSGARRLSHRVAPSYAAANPSTSPASVKRCSPASAKAAVAEPVGHARPRSIRTSAAASAAGSSGATSRPVSSSRTRSRTPPTSVATTGTPAGHRLEDGEREDLGALAGRLHVAAALGDDELGPVDEPDELDRVAEPEAVGLGAQLVGQRLEAVLRPADDPHARAGHLLAHEGERVDEDVEALVRVEAARGDDDGLGR